MITVVIIDSDSEFRRKIASILLAEGNFMVLGQGKDAFDALKLTSAHKPDIAILDSRLDFINGEEIPPLIRARSSSTAAVVLEAKTSDYQLYKAAANGVSGLIHKETDIGSLPWILKSIFDGECFISPFLAARVLRLLAIADRDNARFRQHLAEKLSPKNAKEKTAVSEYPTTHLSRTELQILACIGEGNSSNEIAKHLDLAVGTVRNYISAVMHKTGLHNRAAMARYAFKYGLVTLV
ncbi:MAG: response regulator transcription factor [Treponema sp.]|nr:response regulator transcription factor [Treponema sp.]